MGTQLPDISVSRPEQ